MTLKRAEEILCRYKPKIDHFPKMIIINFLESIDQKEMTAKQAQDDFNRKFPNIQRENLALWLVVMNLLEQVESGEPKFQIVESKINQTAAQRK